MKAGKEFHAGMTSEWLRESIGTKGWREFCYGGDGGGRGGDWSRGAREIIDSNIKVDVPPVCLHFLEFREVYRPVVCGHAACKLTLAMSQTEEQYSSLGRMGDLEAHLRWGLGKVSGESDQSASLLTCRLIWPGQLWCHLTEGTSMLSLVGNGFLDQVTLSSLVLVLLGTRGDPLRSTSVDCCPPQVCIGGYHLHRWLQLYIDIELFDIQLVSFH